MEVLYVTHHQLYQDALVLVFLQSVDHSHVTSWTHDGSCDWSPPGPACSELAGSDPEQALLILTCTPAVTHKPRVRNIQSEKLQVQILTEETKQMIKT